MFSEFPRAIFSFESPAPRYGSKIHSEIVHADLFPKRLSEMKVEFSPGKNSTEKVGQECKAFTLHFAADIDLNPPSRHAKKAGKNCLEIMMRPTSDKKNVLVPT